MSLVPHKDPEFVAQFGACVRYASSLWSKKVPIMCPLNRIFHHPKAGQPSCPICKEPVSLENSKTDEDGHATHEECYVQKICSKSASSFSPKNIVNSH